MNHSIIVPGTIVKHFKGNLYKIITLAEDSETGKMMVVYQAMYAPYKTYVRAYDMFISEVDKEKYPDSEQQYRFVKVAGYFGEELATPIETNTEEHSNVEPELVTIQKDKDIIEITLDNSDVDPVLLKFLDADSTNEKLKVLNEYEDNITESVMNAIEASLDIAGNNDSLSMRIDYVKTYLNTRNKYENTRFR